MKEIILTVLLMVLGALPGSGGGFQCQQIPQPNPRPGGQFGCSVNLHNGDLAIGANLDGAGSVTLCPQGGSETPGCQQKSPDDGRPGDEFGRAVAVDDNWLIVGAPFANGSGIVYVYNRDLTLKQKLTASDGVRGDQFGITLALSNDTLIVGAPNNVGTTGSLSGAVYIFHWDGNTWMQGQKLTADDARAFDNFGFSLAIDGNIVVIGAPFHEGAGANSGEAYVFEWNGKTWSQTARLAASDAAAGDEYGSAIAVSGTYLAVGARRDDVSGMQDAGSAYVYERPDSAWKEVAHFFGQAAGDQFGAAASMDGNQLLIGALLHNGSGPESGAAYLFQRLEGGWSQSGAPFLGTASRDRFGQAVSIHKNAFLVGAYLADPNSVQDAGSAALCGMGAPVHTFTVAKDDHQKEVFPGESLTYSITVTNTGTQAASAVEVTDTFSAKLRDVSWCVPGGQPDCAHPHTGDIDWTIPLSPQASITFSATATVRLNASGMITNEACAQVPGEANKFCGHDDPPDEIVPTPCGDVNLELTKTGPASAKPGDTITYTLTVKNHGTCPATGVHLADPIPAGLKFPGSSGCSLNSGGAVVVCDLPNPVPQGGSATVSLPFTVLETCLPSIMNKATVSANEGGPVQSNQVSTRVDRTADLAISKIAPASVNPGDSITYHLTVTNLGPDIACGVLVSDPIPAGLTSPVTTSPCGVTGNEIRCSIAELPAEAPFNVSNLQVSFTAPASCGSKITNTATVSAVPSSADPQPSNDSATAMTMIGPLPPSITKTVSQTTARPGDPLTYTIVVNNPSGSPVTVTDVFPPGLTAVQWCRVPSCTTHNVGDLHDVLTGSSATYQVQATVSPTFPGALVINTASVAGPPECPSNSSATATTQITGVTVLCGGIDGTQVEGGTVIYTFLLRNDDPVNPTNVFFEDILPDGLTLDSASANSEGLSFAGPAVLWEGSIPEGEAVTIKISGTIDPGTKGMTFCNTPIATFGLDDNLANAVVVPCCFTIPATVPTLSEPWLAVLALLLALLALRRLRCRTL